MKGIFFFKDESGHEVVIEEFDYDYVRNSLLKVYDRHNLNKVYKFNVIVKKDYAIDGTPVFDVRELNLNDIFFNTTALRVLELMKDDIIFNKISIREISKPKLQAEWEDYQKGIIVYGNKSIEKSSLDLQPIVYTRNEISPDDPRITDIVVKQLSTVPMKVLDWIDNFDICSAEMGKSNQLISESQLQLVQVLKSNSDYISGIFENLTTVIESLFPLKPGLAQKLFGFKKDITVKQSDLSDISRKLNKAVEVDANKFSSIQNAFKGVLSDLSAIKNNVENGIVGCSYAVTLYEDPYEFELRLERLMKVRATTEISEMSLSTAYKKFFATVNKLKEVQEVLIPLLIVKLQNQASSKIDESTVDIIRRLAYNRDITVENDETTQSTQSTEKSTSNDAN